MLKHRRPKTVSDYSLKLVVTDGLLTAPRWLQHLFKIMTSAGIALPLLALGLQPVLVGIVAAALPDAFSTVRESVPAWTTYDHSKSIWWTHITDSLTDLSLGVVGALVPCLVIAQHGISAMLAFGISVVLWVLCHKHANP